MVDVARLSKLADALRAEFGPAAPYEVVVDELLQNARTSVVAGLFQDVWMHAVLEQAMAASVGAVPAIDREEDTMTITDTAPRATGVPASEGE